MEKHNLYRCDTCGNIIEVIIVGGGELVCCGNPMIKLVAQNEENAMEEKHVPIILRQENGLTEIRVGEVLHPMTDGHYIMFIEAISKDKNRRVLQYLYPNQEPKMLLKDSSDDITAREYCNIHGLWQTNS